MKGKETMSGSNRQVKLEIYRQRTGKFHIKCTVGKLPIKLCSKLKQSGHGKGHWRRWTMLWH